MVALHVKPGMKLVLTYKSGSEVIEISAGSSCSRSYTTFSVCRCSWRRGSWFTEEAHYHIHHEHSERESFQHLPCCLLRGSLTLSCCWGSIPCCRGLQHKKKQITWCVYSDQCSDQNQPIVSWCVSQLG